MDELRAKSEKELKRIERELTKIYEQSQKEIHEKWDSYLQRAAERTKRLEEALEKAKASGDAEKIKEAQEALKRKVDSVTRQDAKFNAMARETAERLTDVNAIATAYINNEMPKVYALNYNGMIEDIENDLEGINTGIAFNLVDERTVKQLVKDDKLLYSNKTLDKAADMKWNLKAITSQVTQGIIQGESIPKIAKRLDNVSDMDKNAAIRSARTLTTTAENSGRMAGMKEAEEKGIVYEKQWMATPDDRTRESHAELDGVSVPLDKPFPNGLMYPADMKGKPEEVWNCRCSMVRKLIGFRRDDGSISEVGDIEHYERRIGEEKKAEEPKPELHLDKLSNAMSAKDFEEFKALIDNAENRKLYEMYGNDCKRIEVIKSGGYYTAMGDTVRFSLDTKTEGVNKFSTAAHEMGHMFDKHIGKNDSLSFNEVGLINSKTHPYGGDRNINIIKITPSTSDEFLGALREDMEKLKPSLFSGKVDVDDATKKWTYLQTKSQLSFELLETKEISGATSGIQDALDGFFGTQDKGLLYWGHGDRYYNRIYNQRFKDMGVEKQLKAAMQELGFDASNQTKVKAICRQYEAASEAWANVSSAVTVGGKELEMMEKYMPKTVEAYKKIVGGL